jgi:hypothetical protein
MDCGIKKIDFGFGDFSGEFDCGVAGVEMLDEVCPVLICHVARW